MFRLDGVIFRFFSVMSLPPARSTLFPYTTLFRSGGVADDPRTQGRPDRVRLVPVPGQHGGGAQAARAAPRSEEHTSELQSLRHLVCRLLLEKKKKKGCS